MEKELKPLNLEYYESPQPILNLRRWIDEQIEAGANTVNLNFSWYDGQIETLELIAKK